MKPIPKFFSIFAVTLTAQPLAAQQSADVVVYLGAGTSVESEIAGFDATPLSFGAIFMPTSSPMVFGVDIAGEGEMLDSTFGRDSYRQALSFNALLGGRIFQTDKFRTDAMVLLGARESVTDCPDSVLGFQCYADREPDATYDFNYGAVVTATFDKVAIGLRVTGESAQVVLGFKF